MIDPSVQPDGKKIKKLRLALKLRQEDLAREAVCGQRTVENAEAGKRVKESSLNDIANALGVAVSELICDDPLTPPTFRGRAEFRELCALGDGRVRKLTSPCYYGKSENAILTIRGTEAELIIENLTMYDDAGCSKERFSGGLLKGCGPVVRGSVNIRYTVKEPTGRRSWAGVCVLWFPVTGKKIHGYWMTEGHSEQGRIVLGVLELVEPT
jgi:transcriptional regulator with XRE-family HTH domain